MTTRTTDATVQQSWHRACSVKTVQRTLGHASATVTHYADGHLWPDSEDQVRSVMDAALTQGGSAEVAL